MGLFWLVLSFWYDTDYKITGEDNRVKFQGWCHSKRRLGWTDASWTFYWYGTKEDFRTCFLLPVLPIKILFPYLLVECGESELRSLPGCAPGSAPGSAPGYAAAPGWNGWANGDSPYILAAAANGYIEAALRSDGFANRDAAAVQKNTFNTTFYKIQSSKL